MAADRLSLLLQYYAEDPSDAFTCFALAHEYAKRGELERACELYELLISMQPAYTGTYYHLGKLYAELNRTADAAAVYHKGITICSQEGAMKDLSELKQALMALDDG